MDTRYTNLISPGERHQVLRTTRGKADPTEDTTIYHRIIETAGGSPVLVRDGSKADEEVIFQCGSELLQQGAHGIVYGRNIIQHPRPATITQGMMGIS